MKIISFSIRRPVTVSMFYLGIILFGIISYSKLPQELFPSLSYPEISVFTHYENASPQEVESLITRPLEETIATTSRLKRIKSISREGWSMIQASFTWGTDMDMASLYVREKIDLVRDRLPDEAGEPVVLKMNPFELPVMVVTFYLKRGDENGEQELTSFWKRRLKDELEKVEGVANAQVSGGITPEIEVSVEPGALWSKGLSLREVVDALKKTNYSYPAGSIKDDYFEYLVRTAGEYKDVEEIKKTVLTSKDFVALGDIAVIKEAAKKRTSFSRYNGKPSLTIALKRQSNANTMRISRALRKKVESLKKDLPGNMQLSIIYDQAQLIREAVAGVRDAAVCGGMLSFFVLYLFIRNRAASILVALSIVLSSMGGLLLIYFSGITLNIISLGGFALGIGMMVDNAIVVIENLTHSNRREALKGSEDIVSKVNEVGPAIFSSTLTTVATFLPMIFAAGLAGQMIKELAFAITFCLLFSLLVAFTFIPCFWGRIHSHANSIGPETKMAIIYEGMLRRFLKRKGMYLFFLTFVFGLSIMAFLNLRREFAPDTGEPTFYLDLKLPEGSLLNKTDEFAREVEGFLLSLPEIKEVTSTVGELEDKEAKTAVFMGEHEARLMITLYDKHRKRRKEVTAAIREYFKGRGKGTETCKVIIPRGIAGMGTGEQGLAFEVKGYNLEKVGGIVGKIKEKLKKINGIKEVWDNAALPLPEKKITLDREKIAIYGLSVKEVAEAVQASRVGVVATYLKREGGDIPIRVQLEQREGGNFLKDIFFITPSKMRVLLGEVAGVSRNLSSSKGQPSEIQHIDQERAVIVGAAFSKENKWRDRDVVKFLDGIPRDESVSVEIAGERAMIKESFRSLCFILVLAVVLIYMIMAAQFESLWQPFIIMFSLPTALIGVAFLLYFRGMSLNIISLLGIILLGGITVNNGIVLVSCIDQYRKNMPLKEAVVQGCVRRLRPVLMTALTTIVALLPLSMGLGKGAELRTPMATAVMGGLVTSTILTLFVIPAFYLIGSRVIKK